MRFYLRTTKADGTATLYTDVQRRRPKVKLKLSTPIEVDVKEWCRAIRTPNNYAEFLKRRTDIADKMKLVQDVIETALLDGVFERDAITERINNAYYKEQRELAEELAKRRKAEQQRVDNQPLRYLSALIERMKNGTIRTKQGLAYSHKYILTYQSLLSFLNNYFPKGFDWEDVNRDFEDRLSKRMLEDNYMVNSINAKFRLIKIICSMAYDEGLHTSTAYTKISRMAKRDDEERKEIYLNADEVQALYDMKLVGTQADVRDVFLVGCYTCQRFSDYGKIQKFSFGTTAKGTNVVRLIQKKTRNSVTIPVLNDNLLAIMERHKYKLPTILQGNLNEQMPLILKRLADTMPSLAIKERTHLTQAEINAEKKGKCKFERDKQGNVLKPRYELVTSHTARRSGITNLYLTGMFDMVEMMSISGHKDADTFKKYIRVTQDEVADRIAWKNNATIQSKRNGNG